MTSTPSIGLIGGTGFYHLLDDAESVEIETPYGPPSAPPAVGKLADKTVAFLPRHGLHHEYAPESIPARANIWALKELGVRQIVGFNTVGSLQPGYQKGDLVLADQFVDRTYCRPSTFFDGRGEVAHISSALPYCARLRERAQEILSATDERVHPMGTIVVIQGPRFSTVAESRWFTQQGWHLVNMTQFPEVVLAREAEICYANLSYITDYDVGLREVVGLADEEMVSHEGVLRVFGSGSARVREIVRLLVEQLPAEADCSCRRALEGARG